MNAKIAILHLVFNILGGAEYLVFNMAEALKDKYSVTIVTSTEVDSKTIKNIFNIDISKFNLQIMPEYNPLKYIKGRLIKLKTLLAYRKILKNVIDKLKNTYDFIVDTQSNIPTNVDLAYIHYPYMAETYRSLKNKKIYDLITYLLHERWFGKPQSARICTNSTFTARIIYRHYHIIPDIIYPPVDVEYFECEQYSKEDYIVTISRFTPEKKLHKLLQIAKYLTRYKWYIFGSRSGVISKYIEKQIRQSIQYLNVDNLFVKLDAPRSIIKEYLCKAKIYIHPPFSEHFGIAIVEAMAAGVIPIVYKHSGAYIDIVSKIDPRLGYYNINEIPKIIEYINKREKILVLKAIEVAKTFSKEIFKKQIVEYISRLILIKGV